MRISDLANVTGIPLATLKDLRHRSILELASVSFGDDPDEIRRWGSFSAPDAMIVMGAAKVRNTYGLSWDDAVTFSRIALGTVEFPISGGGTGRFYDLRANNQEIWVGRFDFGNADPVMEEWWDKSWNYFSGPLVLVVSSLNSILEKRARAHEEHVRNDYPHFVPDLSSPQFCMMLNASQLCREFWQKATEVNAVRDWDNR